MNIVFKPISLIRLAALATSIYGINSCTASQIYHSKPYAPLGYKVLELFSDTFLRQHHAEQKYVIIKTDEESSRINEARSADYQNKIVKNKIQTVAEQQEQVNELVENLLKQDRYPEAFNLALSLNNAPLVTRVLNTNQIPLIIVRIANNSTLIPSPLPPLNGYENNKLLQDAASNHQANGTFSQAVGNALSDYYNQEIELEDPVIILQKQAAFSENPTQYLWSALQQIKQETTDGKRIDDLFCCEVSLLRILPREYSTIEQENQQLVDSEKFTDTQLVIIKNRADYIYANFRFKNRGQK